MATTLPTRICLATIALLSGLSAEPALASDGSLDLGGAIRFNLGWRDYGESSGNGDLDLELLRVDASGERGRGFFSLQYRWYDGFDAVHHAWAGLRLDESRDLKLGIQQVPFGLLPYASQSFWFGSGYYLGLEDDHDIGVVYRHAAGQDEFHAGLFLADEYGDGARFDRYSFDVADDGVLRHRERERLHLRWQRRSPRPLGSLAFGASGFSGKVEDLDTQRRLGHHGAAVHAERVHGAWTLQGQWAWYRFDVPGNRIALSAFQFPFEIASEGHVVSVNAAHALPATGWFDAITCYNNLSATLGRGPGNGDSLQNVVGCSFAKGKSFSYVDWISGRNMWFIGGPGIGLAPGTSDPWRSRLNVNIGFYF